MRQSRGGAAPTLVAITALFFLSPLPAAAESNARDRDAARTVGLEVGLRPPALQGSDLQDHRQTLDAYAGKVLVLHFWASWCPFCRGEIPKLKQAHEMGKAQGVAVLTVSVDEEPAPLARFVQQARLPYPVVVDARGDFAIADRYQIDGIPVTFILARDGRIIARLDGPGDILGAVEQALAN